MNGTIKTKISKKQFKELIIQFQKDPNYFNYKSQNDEYFSFLHKKGNIDIKLYKFDKNYYLEIVSLS